MTMLLGVETVIFTCANRYSEGCGGELPLKYFPRYTVCNSTYLRRFQDGHAPKRRLSKKFWRLAVIGVVELRDLKLDAVVLGRN